MKIKTSTIDEVCNVEYGTRVVRKKDGGSIYPVYGGGGKTFFLDKTNRKNRIVISRFAMSKKCTRFVRGDFFLNDSGLTLSPKTNELSQKYLDVITLSFNNLIYDMGRGTAQRNLDMKEFRLLKISYPDSIPEQQRIVAKLDVAFDEINKTINFIKNKEQEVDVLNEIILLNEFKLSLETKKLSEVCKIYNGGTPDTKNKLYWGGKNQWLTPRDMGKLSNEHVDVTLRQLTDEGLKNSSANLVPKNSVILSCRAPIGHLAINNVPMAFNQGCKGLVPSPILLNRYFYYFLLSSKKLLNNLGTGTTFKEISSKVLSSVEINVPSLDEQKKIINKFDLIFRDLKILKNINKKQIKNYTSLGNAIVSKEIMSKAS